MRASSQFQVRRLLPAKLRKANAWHFALGRRVVFPRRARALSENSRAGQNSALNAPSFGGVALIRYSDAELQDFLNKFYMSRIGIRILIGQHIALHEEIEGWVGLICLNTSPVEIAHAAVDSARQMCYYHYGDAPEVTIVSKTTGSFPYIPSHLHHMLFELLKNSMRAVVEEHGIDGVMPKIKVIIADGETNEDVSIKVSDEGGGISRSDMPQIWNYAFTTANQDTLEHLMGGEGAGSSRDFDGGQGVLAGLGYGLPIVRLFARYFGGDLQVISMEGYGTDAYLHMRKLGDSLEPLE